MSDEGVKSESEADELMHQQEFGRGFKVAREATELSLNNVSEALKLPVEIIRAMESSQVDGLPAPAFTRGYIRNYARFLKISEDDILAIYNQCVPAEEVPLTARSSLAKQTHSGEVKVKLVTYGLAFVVLIGIILWLSQSSSDIEEAGVDNSVNHFTKSKEVFHKPAGMQIDVNEEQSMPAMEKKTEKVVVENAKHIDVTSVVDETVNNNSAPKVEKIEVKSDSIEVVAKGKSSENIVEFSAASGDDVLVIGTISESWLDIGDVNTPRLVYELIKKGGFYRVQGQTPFKVFLGNAPSVSLQLNGKPVNVLGFLRSTNIAHVYIYKNGEVIAVSRKQKIQNTTSDEKPAEAVE